jgi:sulfate adenylyltransferase
MPNQIQPHGAAQLTPCYVESASDRLRLEQEARSLNSIVLTSAAAGNAVMLAAGYFTPLLGFMSKVDALAVGRSMQTTSGLFWPIPVLNLVQEAPGICAGDRIALKDPNVDGNPVLAVQDVESVDRFTADELEELAAQVFGTRDRKHPGVAEFLSQGRVAIAGPIKVLNYSYFPAEFPDTFCTAVEIRNEIAKRGWRRVVAFQTRNPMHRAHEELCRMAMERLQADGLVIHMLLGKLKPGDIPAAVRDAAIRKMVELYFPHNSTLITGYGFDMLYAGPREALLHAIFRQNMGATHLIVGRDHAGVGDFYGPFDAQEIFDRIPKNALQIEIFKADNTAYSKRLHKVVMMREAPDHIKEDFVQLSGTKVREMLGNGIAPPPEFSRPEVAQILIDYYRSTTSCPGS